MAGGSFATQYTSLVLNGHGFTNYLDGDILELNPVNPLTSQITGNESVSIIKRSDANVYELVVRLLKFSTDDVYMNTQMNQYYPVIFAGSLKENYINQDSIESVETWDLRAGSITIKPSKITNNQDGNALMQYTIRFNQAIRTI